MKERNVNQSSPKKKYNWDRLRLLRFFQHKPYRNSQSTTPPEHLMASMSSASCNFTAPAPAHRAMALDPNRKGIGKPFEIKKNLHIPQHQKGVLDEFADNSSYFTIVHLELNDCKVIQRGFLNPKAPFTIICSLFRLDLTSQSSA